MEEIINARSSVEQLSNKLCNLDVPPRVNWFKYRNASIGKDSSENVLIDDRFKYLSISGIKGELFPHQKTILHALVHWIINDAYLLNKYKHKIKSSLMFVQSCFGTGKTLIGISLIYFCKLHDLSSSVIYKTVKTCTKNNSVLPIQHKTRLPVLIIVDKSLINSWYSEINKFMQTPLKILYIKDLDDIYKFLIMTESNMEEIKSYDAIILRDMHIYDIKKDYASIIENKYNYKYNINTGVDTSINIFSALFEDISFNLLILDDIRSFQDVNMPDAYKTIVLTGNSRLQKYKFNYNNVICQIPMNDEYRTMFHENNIQLMNKKVHAMFKIVPTLQFLSDSIVIDNYLMLIVNVYDPDDIYNEICINLSLNCYEIKDALNKKNFDKISNILDAKITKISDLFNKVMGAEYLRYIEDIKTLQYVEDLLNVYDTIPNEPGRTKLTPKYFIEGNEITYKQSGLKEVLISTKDIISSAIKNNKRKIDNVTSLINTQICYFCYDITNTDKVIFTCMKNNESVFGCTDCFGTYMKNATVNNNNIQFKCIICTKHNCTLSEDVIILNKDLPVNTLLTNDMGPILDIIDEEANNEKILHETWKKYIRVKKIDVILDIIEGFYPVTTHNVNYNSMAILQGNSTLQYANYRKVIVATSSKAGALKLKKELKHFGYTASILEGSTKKIAELVSWFNTISTASPTQDQDQTQEYTHENMKPYGLTVNDRILIINSIHTVSGLNLQSATDLIIYDHLEKVDEEQLIGRVIRCGMLYHTKVWFIYSQVRTSDRFKSVEQLSYLSPEVCGNLLCEKNVPYIRK